MFVSILVHELGHALLMRRFGYFPRIVMYHFGGLAIPEAGYSAAFSKPQRDTWSSVLTSLAGPGAGFVFAALVTVLVYALGGRVELAWENLPALPWDVRLPRSVGRPVYYLINFLLAINIFWGLINLAPVLPLDGGQVARDLLLHRDRYNGLVHAIQLSVAMGVIIAAFFWLTMKDEYAAIMFGLLAISNFLTLQQLGRKW
jgi:Zn-dependent protease